ncbi:hypothetical protein FHX42_000787 [Saccharopolyspora lacisalsi]|uniref:Uncharacterized protein n=1 Tax=Halosaccharopolyspora lacisalsi TaxID=1000566 RepID=A0A839DXJ2_9PSEU|nr:hypothetical protein [Halosaccharopolyspora lacisalsi]MBA8823458.1 hypothetical protein [Halosaccharopolyspora lacisalsi]
MSKLEMGTWVGLDDEPVEYTVLRDEVELDLGGRGSGFEILATERGLTVLADRCTEALGELRARRRREELVPE